MNIRAALLIALIIPNVVFSKAIPDGQCAIITGATKSEQRVLELILPYRENGNPLAIQSNNGFLASSFGIFNTSEGKSLTKELIAQGIIPPDSYCGNADRFVAVLYPNADFSALQMTEVEQIVSAGEQQELLDQIAALEKQINTISTQNNEFIQENDDLISKIERLNSEIESLEGELFAKDSELSKISSTYEEKLLRFGELKDVTFEYLVFNNHGERILLSGDGTWKNIGPPSPKEGITVYNVALATKTYLYEGDERLKCEVTVRIENNSPYDFKNFGLSYNVYDDLDDRKLFMFADSPSTGGLRNGEAKTVKHEIPRSCDHYQEKGWYVEGEINPYTVKLSDKSANKDDAIRMIFYSNEGVLEFKNGS